MPVSKRVERSILFRFLAVLDPRVGHTMDVLSPFISILCHSDWLFHVFMLSIQAVHGLSRLRAPGIVHSLHYLFLQATPLFPHGVTIVCWIFSVLLAERRQDDVLLHSFRVSSFHSRTLLQAILALSLVVSLSKLVRCDFSIFLPRDFWRAFYGKLQRTLF